MRERVAFTAKYWGQRAVVCRAVEDHPGPVVMQEFGQFESWTQANTFARRLNEGLDLDPIEANHIVIGSELRTNEPMRAAESVMVSEQSCARSNVKFLRAQFALAELELALTFCRLASQNPERPTERLLRNARKALFNAMHSELAGVDAQLITERMARLAEALQGFARGKRRWMLRSARRVRWSGATTWNPAADKKRSDSRFVDLADMWSSAQAKAGLRPYSWRRKPKSYAPPFLHQGKRKAAAAKPKSAP